jgi:penicillin amidase
VGAAIVSRYASRMSAPHFDDEARLWRRNQSHPVPFALGDVIAAKESRAVAAAP